MIAQKIVIQTQKKISKKIEGSGLIAVTLFFYIILYRIEKDSRILLFFSKDDKIFYIYIRGDKCEKGY